MTHRTSDKPAAATFPIHELLAERFSPLAFERRVLADEQVGALFEAARWSASSYNSQPWRFVIAACDDEPAFEAVLGCLADANRAWAKDASLLGIGCARSNFELNDKPNAHARYDTGAALAQLTVQASAMHLVVHQMAGFDPERARTELHIPSEYEPIVAFAVGELGDEGALTGQLLERSKSPRERKPLDEILFDGCFGRSWNADD